MTKDSKFKPGQSGNASTTFKPGNPHRWQPGQSGNPAGISRRRAEFEEKFLAALLDRGSPDEVANILWDSARAREHWAVQALLQRLAPETKQINVKHGLQDETIIDYSRLSQDDLDRLEAILDRATAPTGPAEEGKGAA